MNIQGKNKMINKYSGKYTDDTQKVINGYSGEYIDDTPDSNEQ